MTKTPGETKQIKVSNSSDLFGDVTYSKNLNLDEEGYYKLSSRAVALISETDDADVGIPISFGRLYGGVFYVVTDDEAFEISINSPISISVAQDNDSPPSLDPNSYGRWWQNRWYVSTEQGLYYKQVSNGSWHDTGASLSNVLHPIEVFRNKNALAVGNGNTVRLYDTTHTEITASRLTIPADYEVIGLAYCNNKMAVTTRLSDTAQGQNQEAYIFIWDGASTSASGGFPVGSDNIYAITPYKSSWVILTRAGEFKYFNGGGFQSLDFLPFYYLNLIWGDMQNRDMYGDTLQVDGDVIYVNLPGELENFGNKGEKYLENNGSGILCYDPVAGFYNRYTPSISPANTITVPDANINTTSNTFTKSAGTLYPTGNPIKYTSSASTPITGLTINQVYYIINLDGTNFKLALTKEDADAGIAVDISGVGAASNYFLALKVLDYGASRTGNHGAVALMGTISPFFDHLMFGAALLDYATTNDYNTICMTVPSFKNIGYFVLAKKTSPNILDTQQKIFIKYRPLKDDDKIVIKYKKEDILGIPVSTPQNSANQACTWTGTDRFTTTNDLSEVESFINDDNGECECEIIAGAGAGSMAQIESISYAGGTYTVVLKEDIDGAAATYLCDVLINNWIKIGEITSADVRGFKEFPIGVASKWIKVKVEMRGVNVTIEECLLLDATQKFSA